MGKAIIVFVLVINFNVITGEFPTIKLDNTTFKKTEGHKLNGYVFESHKASSPMTCILLCLFKRPLCKSVNYQPDAGNDVQNCALSKKLKEQDTASFVVDSTTNYYENYYIANIKSCLDYRRLGYTRDGLYKVITGVQGYVTVYCDFNTEPNSAWTLFTSFAYRHRALASFCNVPFTENSGSGVVGFADYRVNSNTMTELSKHSTHLRITTNFDKHGLSYRDYLRVKIANLDILTYTGNGICKTVERINVRGIEGLNIGVPFWQGSTYILHLDSYYGTGCGFNAASGSVVSEDNFGYYHDNTRNTNYKGHENENSTTNYWFGGYL